MRQCVCKDVKAVWEKLCFCWVFFVLFFFAFAGCHLMQYITSAFYCTSNYATMHSTHSVGSFTFGGGWNRGVFCYEAVNRV